MEPQIVATGGGGFATEPENLLLEQYVLSLSRNRIKPRVLLEQDVIYIGGGNTLNMLLIWQKRSIDTILREAAENGTILCGVSAGSICWFDSGVTDSLAAQELLPMKCLGWLPGSNCPHYDSEAGRRPAYHSLVVNGALPSGYATDDGVGLHFVGTQLAQIVSSRVDARAYEVRLSDLELIETELLPRYLRQ